MNIASPPLARSISLLDALSARWRDPTTGNFTSMDDEEGDESNPITQNRYLYADGDPVNGMDPTGHDFELISLLGAIGIAGLASGFVFAKANRSISYGVLTGAIGAGSIAAAVESGTVVPVLEEALVTAIFPTAFLIGIDWLAHGKDYVENNGWAYVSDAIEGFAWGAFGEEFLNPNAIVEYALTDDKTEAAIQSEFFQTVDQISVSLASLAEDVGLLVTSESLGNTAERAAAAKKVFRNSVKDAITSVIAATLAMSPKMIAAGLLDGPDAKKDLPGFQNAGPQVLRDIATSVAQVSLKALPEQIDATSDEIADWIADRLLNAIGGAS